MTKWLTVHYSNVQQYKCLVTSNTYHHKYKSSCWIPWCFSSKHHRHHHYNNSKYAYNSFELNVSINVFDVTRNIFSAFKTWIGIIKLCCFFLLLLLFSRPLVVVYLFSYLFSYMYELWVYMWIVRSRMTREKIIRK